MEDDRIGGMSGFGETSSEGGTSSGTGNDPLTGAFSGSSASEGTSSAGTDVETGVSAGIVAMLEKLGVNEQQIESVRQALQNANLDESLEKAKEQVTESFGKARDYAKQNPKAVLAGLAVVVVGAGLIAAAVKKSRD